MPLTVDEQVLWRDASSVPPADRLAELHGGRLRLFPAAWHDLMLEKDAVLAVRSVIAWLDEVVEGGAA